MRYELWNTEDQFFLGRFLSEAEALAFVTKVLDEEGDAYAANLELAIGDDDVRNLSGTQLVARARDLAHAAQSVRGAAVAGSS
jgi:hypothetical protein